MSQHVSRPVVRRLALINPTKFLGNMLLAGGLIQHLAVWCQREQIVLMVVLDESFRDLLADSLPDTDLVYYPRQALAGGVSVFQAARLWLQCVRQIRAFQADLAFNLEEDSVAHRLTHLSGARYKVSSTTARYRFGFDEVLDVPRTGRPQGQQSIWHSFADVLQRLDLPVTGQPGYLQLRLSAPGSDLLDRLQHSGLDPQQPFAVLHPGSSKHYKQWPVAHFGELANLLRHRGYQIALVGHGVRDAQTNAAVMAAASPAAEPLPPCVDLCSRLTLTELAQLLRMAAVVAGNDSGPSHLASALGVPGVVIFGPTDVSVWRPLGRQTLVLDNKALCDVTCTRHRCPSGYLCLRSLTPENVVEALFAAA